MTKRGIDFLAGLLLGATILWYAALVFRFHSAGALGDDPSTYVQMALDLAARGTPTHIFPLFNNLFAQGVSWDALITPGYRIVPQTHDIAPTFAFGFPMLLAIAFRVLGDGALFWTTPLLGALSLLATFGVGIELFTDTNRRLISALAVLVLATTPKQIALALVPMSDVPAQLFAVLALYCALRARKSQPHLFAGLTGAALGFGYLIRHPLVVMLVPLALVAARWGQNSQQRIRLIVLALAVTALIVTPDLLYRTRALGSETALENPDSAMIAAGQIPSQALLMMWALFGFNGWGPFVFLAPLGLWLMYRSGERFAAVVLLTWFSAFALFHLPLALTSAFDNNLRYLVPAYPAVALAGSFGLVWLVQCVFEYTRRKNIASRQFIALAGVALLALLALAAAVRALPGPERFVARAYGWMSAESRADFEDLGARLPSNAVIGTSDQLAGATNLFSGREIFRPGNLLAPDDEFPRFLELMRAQGHPVFMLGDWNCPNGSPDEELPSWLASYSSRDTGLLIRGLPYECAQKVYQF